MPKSTDREALRKKKATIAAKKAQEGFFDENGLWVAPKNETVGARHAAPASREKVLRDKK
jgi:hypothetical protein